MGASGPRAPIGAVRVDQDAGGVSSPTGGSGT
jgi:hypothetical protein